MLRKLRNFFSYLMRWEEKIYPPVKCAIVKKNEKSLLGKSYYFQELQNGIITSPFAATITWVFPPYNLHLTSPSGLQILLSLQLTPLNEKIVNYQVSKGQKVNRQAVLFTVSQSEKVERVTMRILWQPELIEKIITADKFAYARPFLKIAFRSPFAKPKWRLPGEYS